MWSITDFLRPLFSPLLFLYRHLTALVFRRRQNHDLEQGGPNHLQAIRRPSRIKKQVELKGQIASTRR